VFEQGLMTDAEQAFGQGVEAQAAGARGAAKTHFERALAIWPGCAAAWSNLGLLHEDSRDTAAALHSYRRALALDPSLFEATLNLATLLARSHQFAEAESLFGQASRLQPQAPEVWSNLGGMLAGLGRHADAQACCWHALALDPGHDKARFNLSYPMLRQGHYADGLLCMEARASSAELQRHLQAPRWSGEHLGGRGLLVVSDAGHGDVIQMARYARTLRALGAGRLVFYGQAGLQRLLCETGEWDEVLPCEAPLPTTGWDVWSPIMSLPYLCQTRLDNIPSTLPYLRVDPDRQAQWRHRMSLESPEAALRIGLVWRGNPRHENDAERSLPHLRALAPLSQIAGVRFYSLQSGAGASDVEDSPPGLPLARLDAELGDFAQTAALVSCLDLVIGVDTSVVHLAGALGVPVWVLISHHKPDWRWLDGHCDSPWYPGVLRLFRQSRPGDWQGTIQEVACALGAAPHASCPAAS
jgi:Flp pilus assembly protein TadD